MGSYFKLYLYRDVLWWKKILNGKFQIHFLKSRGGGTGDPGKLAGLPNFKRI